MRKAIGCLGVKSARIRGLAATFQRNSGERAEGVLFERTAGPNAMSVMLTGMGMRRGLEIVRAEVAFTVAQDEESCVVLRMPQGAIDHRGRMA